MQVAVLEHHELSTILAALSATAAVVLVLRLLRGPHVKVTERARHATQRARLRLRRNILVSRRTEEIRWLLTASMIHCPKITTAILQV